MDIRAASMCGGKFGAHSVHYAVQHMPDAFGYLLWEALCEHEKPGEWGNTMNGANKIQWSYPKV